MPHPYPGQQWKHGWQPLTPSARRDKNHGRPVKPGSATTQGAAKTPAPDRDAKPATSPAESKAFLDGHYGEWRDSLSPAQDKAMRFYQSPGFALMNGQLRGLRKDQIKADVSFNDADLERARKASKDLTSAIRKAPPLDRSITVHRGFAADQFGDLKPGTEITDKGFVSTSLTNDVGSVGKATKQATAEIVLPEGTRAAAGSARELVLPPGSKFKVLSRTTRNGVPHVRMELLLPGKTSGQSTTSEAMDDLIRGKAKSRTARTAKTSTSTPAATPGKGTSPARGDLDAAAAAIKAGNPSGAVNLLTRAMGKATGAEKAAIKKRRDELARKLMGR